MLLLPFQIRYQFYQNCNFTEVGEPFGEQPLAVAVQQGSHLQKEISRVILELQKERYFETLSGVNKIGWAGCRFACVDTSDLTPKFRNLG